MRTATWKWLGWQGHGAQIKLRVASAIGSCRVYDNNRSDGLNLGPRLFSVGVGRLDSPTPYLYDASALYIARGRSTPGFAERSHDYGGVLMST